MCSLLGLGWPYEFMRKTIISTIALALVLGLTACNDKLICPAYQSYYVFDNNEREQMFSLFGEDSLPKMDGDVVKNRKGLVHQPLILPFIRKNEELKTVPMETVMPSYDTETTSDSVGQETNFIAQEVFGNDDDAWKNLAPREYASAGQRKIGINVDQKNYEALFGDYLAEQMGEEEGGGGEDDAFAEPGFGDFEEPKEKRGFLGFFKDLFGGKKRRQQQEAGDEGFGDEGGDGGGDESFEDEGLDPAELDDFEEDPFGEEEPSRGLFGKRKKNKKEKPPKQKKEKKEKPPKVKKEKKAKEPKEDKPPKEKKKKKEDDDSDGF